jgi:hypothetical protein
MKMTWPDGNCKIRHQDPESRPCSPGCIVTWWQSLGWRLVAWLWVQSFSRTSWVFTASPDNKSHMEHGPFSKHYYYCPEGEGGLATLPRLWVPNTGSNLLKQAGSKAVLVTGCDSGFGFSLAKHLHSKGFLVFAGCLMKVREGPFSSPLSLHVLTIL